MKLLKYGLPLVALGFMASCSNDNVDAPNVNPNPVEGDGMYMTVNISLPTVKGTRDLDSYEEGISSEYDVKAVDLYLFKLESGKNDPENEAGYIGGDPIHLGFGELDTESMPTDVTGKFNATFRISSIELNDQKKPTDGSKYYGLLVVNPTEYLPTISQGDNFNDWNKKVMAGLSGGDYAQDYTKYMIGENGFMMTNAVSSTSSKTYTLEFVDTETFALSPAEAEANNPAAEFYVQRGVAKVYLTSTVSDDFDDLPVYEGTTDESETKDNATIKVVNWNLDVTNQLTFPVQNVIGEDGEPDYQLWTKPYFRDSEEFDHLWWAVDPNYYNNESDGSNMNAFSSMKGVDNFNWSLEPGYDEDNVKTWAYCLENTMNFDQQLQGQSTRVVFKCKYQLNDEDWAEGSDYEGFIVYNDKAMLVKSDDLVKENVPEAGFGVKLSALIDEDKLSVYTKELMIGSSDDEVDWYPNGDTYYVAYIRHFDDDEAKLPANTDTSSKDFNKSSLTSWTVDQLGRYGVLRNNAYDMNVLGFYGFGSPTVPDPDPNIPDDKTPEKKYNAIVSVNILNWAKRSYDYIPR